jgi:hypothetical protein
MVFVLYLGTEDIGTTVNLPLVDLRQRRQITNSSHRECHSEPIVVERELLTSFLPVWSVCLPLSRPLEDL